MSQNLCVVNPEIKEIFILETGDYLTAQHVIVPTGIVPASP